MSTAAFREADLDRLAADLNRDGICILPGLLDTGLLDRWGRAFNSLFQERQSRPGGLAPRQEARYYLTLPWVEPFADPLVFAHPTIVSVLNRVFAQEYVLVQMGADVPVRGSGYQETHRDFRPLFTEQFVTPLYAVAVNFPLVDVTEENGAFEMAVGTHVLPREEGMARIASGELPMRSFPIKRGDVLIRSPLALHRGSPNRTDAPRPMIVMGYVMHWLHTPKVELELARDFYDGLPEPVRKLLRCQVVDEVPQEKTETYV
jgi:hypothetical protein